MTAMPSLGGDSVECICGARIVTVRGVQYDQLFVTSHVTPENTVCDMSWRPVPRAKQV